MKHAISKISAVLTTMYFALASRVFAAAPPPDKGLSNAPGVDITIGSLVTILNSLACYAVDTIMVVMVIMIIWYGFRMMASQGSDSAFKAAKQSLTYAVVGVLVVMAANTIIATVGNAVEGIGAQDLSTRSRTFIDYTPLRSCR